MKHIKHSQRDQRDVWSEEICGDKYGKALLHLEEDINFTVFGYADTENARTYMKKNLS